MRTQQTFEEGFEELYNDFNNSEKGKKLLKIEGISRTELDVGLMSQKYFTVSNSDMSIDANSNRDDGLAPNCYASEVVKGLMKIDGYNLLWEYTSRKLGKERANEIMKANILGDIYIHDSTNINVPYCKAFSTFNIMTEGRPYGTLRSVPPKRARSFVAQVIETVMDLSQNFCGAIAPADILPMYAWYAKKENLSDADIVNDLQSFTHIANNKFRVSGDSPFTNISIFDRPNLEKLFEHFMYPDGSVMDYEYVMKVQKLFGEFIAKGDPVSGLMYRFPIVTLNIYRDENNNIPDQEFLDWASKVNTKKGVFNIYINDGTKISSCCRMINDQSRMPFRGDSLGNGGLDIGSTRVVTANLPRIARKANRDIKAFKTELIRVLDICRDVLEVHRTEILERRIREGYLKFYSPLKWFNLDHMFSTIGITGIYEMNYFMGLDIRSEAGQEFTSDILNFIEDYAIKTSKETGHSYNLEEIPGETAVVKLAQKDEVIFGDNPFKMYSNQYIPLIEDISIPERIKITGKFMSILSGGSILHLNLAEEIKDPDTMKKLIEYAVKNGVSHFAINYSFGICENEHTSIVGTSDICPVCGGRITEHMTRIIGYFTKVSTWTKVRREFEFGRRKFEEITIS